MAKPPMEAPETPAEEASESPAVEQQEQTEGTEGVTIPEDFQKKVHHIVHKATKHHLQHIRHRVSMREDEIRQEETKKEHKGKGPASFEANPSIE